ncbi:hypothetical protein TrRE_jg12850, partial [Triparma retinervis]
MNIPSPTWRVQPVPKGWYIEAIKRGVVRGILELGYTTLGEEVLRKFIIESGNQGQFRVGRDDDQCEIGISSSLASRVHAVVHFRRVSSTVTLPYIYDCNSTHGVFLNTKE